MGKRCCVRLALVILSFSFSVLEAESTLNFPRLSFDPTTFTAIAIVNPTFEDATVTLTAYGEDGTPLAGIMNPVQIMVAANQQYAEVTSNLFVGAIDPATVAWFQATSETDGLTGFFLFLNAPPTTQFDGADLPESAPGIVFPQVRLDSGYTTEINLINPGVVTAELELQLIQADMTSTQSLSLPSLGVERLDVAEFFAAVPLESDAYVTASSNLDIAGFEFVRSPDGDLVGLNARSATEQLTQLYFPQAVLGIFESSVGVINNSAQAVELTVSFFQSNGTLHGPENFQNNPVTRDLDPGEILVEELASLFGFSGEDLLTGWLQVESSLPAITGFLTYGIPSTGAAATVTPSPAGQDRAIFSHLETSQGFFTGVAVLNPGQLAADVQTVVVSKTGEVVGTSGTDLQPGQRISQLIDQLVPESLGQSGGLIFLESDVPVYASSLFGSYDGQVLANIPPQAAPQAYDPEGIPPCVETVPLTDANLAAAVREALGIEPAADITCEQAETLTELPATNRQITDLGGLEYFTSLTILDLEDNSILDITPVAGLTQLTELDLEENSISDITPVAGLTQLTFLDLEDNSISSITPVAGLTQLTVLLLGNNSISDVTPIAGLTQLTFLDLGNSSPFGDNSILDITPLAGLTQLTYLSVRRNSILNITPVAGLTQLTILLLDGNSISDITPVAGLTQLTFLFLGNNSISDISPIAGLTQLTRLDLSGLSISDITPVAGLTQLTVLGLFGNSISDITPLAGLTQLADLNLIGNSVDDITPLTGLTQLTRLDLNGNLISDITPVTGLTQLTRLDLYGNSVSDITPVAGLAQLTSLSLGNSVSDITPIAGLTQLTSLDLTDNSISDISPITGLTQLTFLGLDTNSISDIAPLVQNAGLGEGDTIQLSENPLDSGDCTNLQTLNDRGAVIFYDAGCPFIPRRN